MSSTLWPVPPPRSTHTCAVGSTSHAGGIDFQPVQQPPSPCKQAAKCACSWSGAHLAGLRLPVPLRLATPHHALVVAQTCCAGGQHGAAAPQELGAEGVVCKDGWGWCEVVRRRERTFTASGRCWTMLQPSMHNAGTATSERRAQHARHAGAGQNAASQACAWPP